MAPKWKDKNISRGFCGDTMKCRTFTGSGHTKIQSDYFQKTTTTTRLKSIPFIEMWAASAPFVFCVGQLRVQVRSAVALGCRRVLHADLPGLKHLNYPLSVSKATVICHPVILRWMRWLPRLSQPVQCKDRKSQGSTPLTPPTSKSNTNMAFHRCSTAFIQNSKIDDACQSNSFCLLIIRSAKQAHSWLTASFSKITNWSAHW